MLRQMLCHRGTLFLSQKDSVQIVFETYWNPMEQIVNTCRLQKVSIIPQLCMSWWNNIVARWTQRIRNTCLCWLHAIFAEPAPQFQRGLNLAYISLPAPFIYVSRIAPGWL